MLDGRSESFKLGMTRGSEVKFPRVNFVLIFNFLYLLIPLYTYIYFLPSNMSSLFEKCPACNGKTSGRLFCSSPCRSSYLSPSHLQDSGDNHGDTARRNSATFPFEIKRPRAPLRIKTCDAIYTNPGAQHINPKSSAQTGLLSPSELKQYEDYFDQDRTLKRRNLSATNSHDYQVTVLPADE
jgi:hypothetical protein